MPEKTPWIPFEAVTATEDDIQEIIQFIISDFLVNEPLNRALQLPWTDAGEFIEEIARESVGSEITALIRNDTGELIAICLNTIKSLSKIVSEPRPSSEKAPGQMDYVANFLWELDRKLAPSLPHGTDKLLKMEILSVSSKYTRRGLAGKLMEYTMQKQRSLQIPCFSEATALASQKLFAKYGFTVVHEILHENHIDTDGKRIFTCDDGTDRGTLVIKQSC